MSKRVAFYLRVSTGGQTTENQRRELEQVAERSGWTIVEMYEDQGISGAKGRDQRPEFDRLCRDAARRHFDVVAAWSVCRLGRSLKDLVNFFAELDALGLHIYLHQQAVDSGTPAGRAMLAMTSVFAEFERAMIRERVVAGLARARAQGKTLGRPRTDPRIEAQIQAALERGDGIRKIARQYGVGVSVVQRLKAAAS